MSKKQVCGILFFKKEKKEVLLFLRDNISHIPYPNQYDLLGGQVEIEETPSQAIIREMNEELFDKRTNSPYKLKGFTNFMTYVDKGGIEHIIFCKEADFKLDDLELREGQRLEWFDREKVKKTKLAFGYNEVVELFLQSEHMNL